MCENAAPKTTPPARQFRTENKMGFIRALINLGRKEMRKVVSSRMPMVTWKMINLFRCFSIRWLIQIFWEIYRRHVTSLTMDTSVLSQSNLSFVRRWRYGWHNNTHIAHIYRVLSCCGSPKMIGVQLRMRAVCAVRQFAAGKRFFVIRQQFSWFQEAKEG